MPGKVTAMSRKNRNQKNNVYVVINLITEYGCPLNGCRYAVASSLGEQQLRRDCAKELTEFEPYIYLTDEMAKAILDARRNVTRWNMANLRHENFCGYVDGFTLGANITRTDAARDPAEILIEREEAEKKKAFSKKVYEALNSLTETQRRRIICRYFEEKTLGEIAREEGVSITTVENILKRALHSMRKILDEAEPVKNEKTAGKVS